MLGPFPTPLDEARCALTPPWRLEQLVRSENRPLCEAVAANPSTPSEALSRLAQDRRLGVRAMVAANPSTPSEALGGLVDLAARPHARVRAAVAANPATPAAALERLSGDFEWRVRRDVAANPSTGLEGLRRLGAGPDPDPEVRWQVASNPSTPPDVLRRLRPADAEWGFRVQRASQALREKIAHRRQGETPQQAAAQGWAAVVTPYGRAVEEVAWGLVRDGFAGSLEDLVAVAVGALG